MRYSPDLRFLVYTAGLGDVPAAPRVVVRDANGAETMVMEGARSPEWLLANTLQAVGPDSVGNVLVRAEAPRWLSQLTAFAGGNQHTAAAGKWATCLPERRRIIRSWRPEPLSGVEPRLSPDGRWLAYLKPDYPSAGVSMVAIEDVATGVLRDVWMGAPLNLRFGFASTTLVWESNGGIFGIADVANESAPVVELGVPGWRCSKPLGLWDGTRIWVAMVLDEGPRGRMVMSDWGRLSDRASDVWQGYIIGSSSGSAFDWDLAGDGVLFHVAFLNPQGICVEASGSSHEPMVDLLPPEPPDPPQPLPDVPFTADPNGRVTVEQMRAFLRAAATACVERDGGTIWWLRKSTEREDWGEWWFERDGYLGLLEDRSTGLRDCPDGKRRSPEECVRDGYDYTTIPLASYSWRGFRGYPWARMEFTGEWDSGPLEVDYVWSNGDVWPGLFVQIVMDAGYGVCGGYPVFTQQSYLKSMGFEDNYWGESGWRRHFDSHSQLDSINRDPAPAFPRGPFVEPRVKPPYPPIYLAEPEAPQEPIMQPVSPSTFLAIPEHLRLGALQRFRDEACWDRDKLPCAPDQVTGGAAALYFWPAYLGTIATLHQNGHAPVNGDWTDASVRGWEAARDAYWRAQGNPHDPNWPGAPPPVGEFSGPIQVQNRDFVS